MRIVDLDGRSKTAGATGVERGAGWSGRHGARRYVPSHGDLIVIDQILQLLAGLEIGNAFGGNFHPRAGFGVAADSRLPLARPEAAESADFNLVATPQGFHYAVEDRLDNNLRILSRHLDDARDFLDQLGFGHFTGHPLSHVNS